MAEKLNPTWQYSGVHIKVFHGAVPRIGGARVVGGNMKNRDMRRSHMDTDDEVPPVGCWVAREGSQTARQRIIAIHSILVLQQLDRFCR